ncbi:MAG TPA: DUF4129 domain-containing protein [Roseiflexaceae bacterium]|nr:DUF4129 domain-containing protein [Roseiflexaceae bacterium]
MKFDRQGAILTALILTAFTTVLFSAVHRFAPFWQQEPLIIICLIVALEAGFVHYVTRQERLSAGEFVRYLVPEILILAVLSRIAATISLAPVDLGVLLRSWLFDPLSILDGIFLGCFVVGLFVGLMTHLMMRDLHDLMPVPGENAPSSLEGHRRYAAVIAADRAEALARIGRRFGMGGILLLIALAAEVANIEEISGPSLRVSLNSTIGTIAYLLCGFLLYSQARLVVLQTRWEHEGAHVSQLVQRRWTRTSLLITILALTLAAVLPRNYGMGFLETLRAILGMIGYVIAMIGYLLLWLFSMLISLPAWLLSLLLPEGGMPAMPTPPPPPPPPPALAEQEPRLLAAIIFWICILLLIGYATSIFLQRHPGLLQRLLEISWLNRLIAWFGVLWRDTSGWAQMGFTAFQQFMAQPVPMPGSATRRRPRGRGPRDLIRYLYQSLLDHAARYGAARHAGQTPAEYRATLADRMPEVQPEIDGLTEAFMTARYSRKPLDKRDLADARRLWVRLRRALRALAK